MLLPDLGSFARWVWPAYGCTLLVFVINLVLALREKRDIRRQCRTDSLQ